MQRKFQKLAHAKTVRKQVLCLVFPKSTTLHLSLKKTQSLTWVVSHTDRDFKNPVARAVHSTARRRNHAKAGSTAAVEQEGTLGQGPPGAPWKNGAVADATASSLGPPKNCTKMYNGM